MSQMEKKSFYQKVYSGEFDGIISAENQIFSNINVDLGISFPDVYLATSIHPERKDTFFTTQSTKIYKRLILVNPRVGECTTFAPIPLVIINNTLYSIRIVIIINEASDRLYGRYDILSTNDDELIESKVSDLPCIRLQ